MFAPKNNHHNQSEVREVADLCAFGGGKTTSQTKPFSFMNMATLKSYWGHFMIIDLLRLLNHKIVLAKAYCCLIGIKTYVSSFNREQLTLSNTNDLICLTPQQCF